MTLIIQKPTGAKVNLAQTFTWNETIWNPSMISTALWLDAADATTLFTTDVGSTQTTDGAVVGRWVDKSGNSRNATVATGALTPVLQTTGLNNLRTVYFNGSNQLNLSSGFLNGTTAVTVAMVMRGLVQNNNAVFGTIASTTQGFTLIYANVISQPTLLRINNVNKILSGLWSTNDAATITTITASASATAGWLNGSTVAATSSTGITALNFNGQYSIGSYANGLRAAMHMSEFIIITTDASTFDRQKLEGYLAHKWGLLANLPNDHPYKTVGPTP
jgi:hypothetical protein